MNKYYYDLHIHSCLSPCGDDDMTPNNIAGMGAVAGLNIMALTDHNTCDNCPAFFEACKRYGVIPVAGMELTTSEDIHVVCLFEKLDDALRFSDHIYDRIMPIDNRPDIFGRQQVMDSEDNVISEKKRLLISATDISIEDAPQLVKSFGGVCYPAHIDRMSNGIIAMLGTFPDYLGFTICEYNDISRKSEIESEHTAAGKCFTLCSSDAHNLADIRDASAYIELEDEPYSGDLVRKNLFKKLLYN